MTDEAVIEPGQYAFRCRSCGHLEEPGAAGENATPAACRVCGKGVHWEFGTNGVPVKVHDADNWQVLADLDGDGLADVLDYHGIDAAEIVGHTPFETAWKRGPDGVEIVTHSCPVCALGLTDHREGQIESAFATRPRHHCKACAAARPGTRSHVEGQSDTVTIPTWVPEQTELDEPRTPPESARQIQLDATEGTATGDVVE